MEFLWLGLLVGFLIVEAATVSLVSIWFGFGALAALLAALVSAPPWMQTAIFLIVSIAFLMLLRPMTRKFFTPRLQRTNTDALLGTVGIVLEEIDNVRACGQVKLGAMTWSARSSNGENIPAGTKVVADRVEGVRMFVTPVEVTVHQ